MKDQYSLSGFGRLTLLAVALCFTLPSRAMIVGPYLPDAATLHLWHLNQTAAPALDAVAGGTSLNGLIGGASLTNNSFNGFGTALMTAANGRILLAGTALANAGSGGADNVSLKMADATTGAFTWEAIVRMDFDPSTNRTSAMELICGEGEGATGGGTDRQWQFRLDPKGFPGPSGSDTNRLRLEFNNFNTGGNVVYVTLPNTGDHAPALGGWFHLAVVYNGSEGTANNLSFYWTRLDETNTAAALAGSVQQNADLAINNNGASGGNINCDFSIGNEARSTGGETEPWLGLMDEVRISSVARAANEMMFRTPDVFIVSGPNPTNQIVAVGAPASFSIHVLGTNVAYQWRHAGTNLPGQTASTLAIASTTFLDEGNYDVVCTNGFPSALTSGVATLTVHEPLNLTWAGVGSSWDSVNAYWTTNNNTTQTIFTTSDHVRFDSLGGGISFVNLAEVVAPGSVVVDADGFDYTFTTFSGGYLSGGAALVKTGTGKLTLDTDNVNTGGTLISNGVIEIGFGASHGSLGSGPITNHTGLVYNRLGTTTFTNTFAGAGGLTNNASGALVFSGTNDFAGDVLLNAGSLTLSGAPAKINSTNITLIASANASGATRFAFSGGVTFASDVVFSLLGSSVTPDNRCTLSSTSSNNVINGPLVLGGDGVIQVTADGVGTFTVNSPVNSPEFTGKLIMRGNGTGSWNSQVQIGGHFSKTDGSLWTLNSTGNSWTNSDIAGGTLRLGANNAIPTSATVNMTGGSLDLGGFNQQVAVLNATSGPIGNSSTNSDSTLTLVNNTNYAGVIQDAISNGTRKVSLTIAGGAVSLSGVSTYTGDTLIDSGTLALNGAGSLNGSAHINVAAGAMLNVAGRTSATPTIAAATTLMGNGSVIGSVTNGGTLAPGASIGALSFANDLVLASGGTTAIEVNKGGNTNDQVIVTGAVVYGGTLFATNLGGTLNLGDTFTIFTAGSASGNFSALTGSPGDGKAWSFNPASGVLSVVTGMAAYPTNITYSVSGGTVTLSWPASHQGWILQAQTNALNVGLVTNSSAWFDLPNTGNVTSTNLPVNLANPTAFFRLRHP